MGVLKVKKSENDSLYPSRPKDWPGGQQEQGHFPRFDLTAFVCDFPYMRPLKYDWESSWYRTGVVRGMHGWHDIF